MHGFHISNICPLADLSGDGIVTRDLGVQPVSAILLNVRCLNNTGTLAQWANGYQIAKAVNRFTLLYRGQGIISMRGEDILAMNYYRYGMMPWLMNPDNVDDEQRSLTIPIFLGRYPWLKSSCFPAVGKGELTVEIDFDDADTGYDTTGFSIDTIELPGAKPTEYERRVQQTMTWPATGNQDIDLPLGNTIRGALLWGTTGYVGATPAPSWGQVSVLVNNQEAGYRSVDWETLQTLHMLRGLPFLSTTEDDHFHTTTTDGNAQTAVSTLGGGGHNRATTYQNYAFIDFDPTGDDAFALDAKDANRVQIRAAVETADAVRCIPVERIKV